jgi:hypothetical protein
MTDPFRRAFEDGSAVPDERTSAIQRREAHAAPPYATPPPIPQTPPRTRSSPGKVAVAAVALISALMCGGTVLASRNGSDTGTGSGGGAQNTAAEPEEKIGDAATQAAALRALLTDSGATRGSIQPAIADVKKCRGLAGATRTFQAAAANRSQHRDQAGTLAYDELPAGDRLRAELTDALNASYRADVAFRQWAVSLARSCTRSAANGSDHLAAAMHASGVAQIHKKAFVALWNPVCDSYGWPRLLPTDV